jgi:hypothetical protein
MPLTQLRSPLSVTALLPCKTPALNQKVAAPACWHKLLSPLLPWQGPGLAWHRSKKGLCLCALRLFVIPNPAYSLDANPGRGHRLPR